MKIAQVSNIVQTMEELKAKGLWLYGADVEAEKSYSDTEMTGSIGLVIGGEGKGLSRLVKDKCDVLVSIPMKGKISSLNASNAASILIYEAVRQSYGRE
jgi:23S rRNA (guanosine2251-2'-O)-methyltransferase